MIMGTNGSGKTTTVMNLLENPKYIYYENKIIATIINNKLIGVGEYRKDKKTSGADNIKVDNLYHIVYYLSKEYPNYNIIFESMLYCGLVSKPQKILDSFKQYTPIVLCLCPPLKFCINNIIKRNGGLTNYKNVKDKYKGNYNNFHKNYKNKYKSYLINTEQTNPSDLLKELIKC